MDNNKTDLHAKFGQIGKEMDLSDIGREIKTTAIKGSVGVLAFAAVTGLAIYIAAKKLSDPKP